MTGSPPTDYVWHSFYAVINALPRVWPYRHLVLENFLHPDLYRALVADDIGRHLSQRNDPAKRMVGAEAMRFALAINRSTDLSTVSVPALRTLWATLTDSRLTNLLTQKFADEIAKRHGTEPVPTTFGLEAIEDRTGYALLPHVDSHQKMVTTLIYLAEPGADEALGTSIYRLNRTTGFAASFAGNARLRRDQFGIATTVPYRPNTALIFAPGSDTFHGVEPVAPGTTRRLIQFQINCDTDG